MKTRFDGCEGFTLVEVALAILVIGLGVVAVFGLFPSGLELSRRTMNETHAALFAEEVFGGFRAKAAWVPWAQINQIRVPVAGAGITGQWAAMPTVGITGNTVTTLVWRLHTDTNLVDRAIRYQLIANNIGPAIVGLKLVVYPGEFGGTTESYEFYTEILRRDP